MARPRSALVLPRLRTERSTSSALDPDGDPLSFLWAGPFGQIGGVSPTVQLLLGTSTVTLAVDDGRGGTASDTAQITVRDTTAPAISAVTVEPGLLWPPDHRMVPVTLAFTATDVCDAAPSCAIETVTSNEPIAEDFSIDGPLQLELRADRLGSEERRALECERAPLERDRAPLEGERGCFERECAAGERERPGLDRERGGAEANRSTFCAECAKIRPLAPQTSL